MSKVKQYGAQIRVMGIGGGGGNTLEDMISHGINGVVTISANTDYQALENSNAQIKVQLGAELTSGLGAGANPEVGREAAEESESEIRSSLEGTDMLFITAGMGGGTGTGAAPVIAKIAKDMNILTVAVVTRPFNFEGDKRSQSADEGIERLKDTVDSLITIPNDKLLTVLGKSVTLVSAFRSVNTILQGAVQGISDLITRPGLINVDFADVRTVMSEMGRAMMGSGFASGEDRAEKSAMAAISSPLLDDVDLKEAKGVLVNITSSSDMSIGEFVVVGDIVKGICSSDATVVIGTVIDPEMTEDLRVTVVVTGLPEKHDGVEAVIPSPFSQQRTKRVAYEPSKLVQPESESLVRPSLLKQPSGLREAVTEKSATSTSPFKVPAFLRRKEVKEVSE
ncbi:cell division protein FtsZ [Gammaproteobacteria bacterium]|nr:cell division protein FtsZ [Gammaproteobacteria bacterium]